MKLILKASTLILALGLGAPQALAEAGPGYSPYGGHRPLYRGAGLGFGHHYAARPFLGMRRWHYARTYAIRSHRFAYAPRARYYAYRPRVRYA
jgi:hypothetical protein